MIWGYHYFRKHPYGGDSFRSKYSDCGNNVSFSTWVPSQKTNTAPEKMPFQNCKDCAPTINFSGAKILLSWSVIRSSSRCFAAKLLHLQSRIDFLLSKAIAVLRWRPKSCQLGDGAKESGPHRHVNTRQIWKNNWILGITCVLKRFHMISHE